MSDGTPSVETALEQAGLEFRAEASKSEAPQQKAQAAQAAAENGPAAAAAELTNETLAGLVTGVAAALLPMVDRRLQYSPEEQAAVAQPLKLVFDKYFPDGAAPIELVLVATCIAVTAPKLLSDGGRAGAGGSKSTDAVPTESTH